MQRREYHISVKGNDFWNGDSENPFRTISQAAKVAQAGDTIIVHEGEYREWVSPENGGTSNYHRIVYKAADGEKVVIKGSERIQDWENVEGTVWKCELQNSFFGDYNPYKEVIEGDWLLYPEDHKMHTGDVYLNGKSFYEAKNLDEVKNPEMRTVGYNPPWKHSESKILNPEDTIYKWYAEVTDETTTIYANFHGADPNEELTEINVRKCCFYPEKTGRNYITVKGFEMAQAATPWTPPTADQPGLLGVNWSKGWIIEDNKIHDSKCSGISIGKEELTGHNLRTVTNRKPGYQYQLESVFSAYKMGWSKENIGSHIIRNNEIYDCGQNGIVGHLGCIFSEIYDNHIYNIGTKHEYFGHEIAGIKLHAPIDVQITRNNFHNCTLGTWLDWQAQGVRISQNLYYNNDRDIFIEVTHGPHTVDNNIFASEYNFDNVAQGGAYINNLFCGTIRRIDVLDRSTPYHYPHSTDVAGGAFVHNGDDRFYQNIFVGCDERPTDDSESGTKGYDGHPTSLEEYISIIEELGNGDHEMFFGVKDPVYINKNAYLKGASAFEKEEENLVTDFDPKVKVEVLEDGTYITMDIPEEVFEIVAETINTEKLGMVRIAEALFEDPNGNPIEFDKDYFGDLREESKVVGPFKDLKPGVNKFKVWG